MYFLRSNSCTISTSIYLILILINVKYRYFKIKLTYLKIIQNVIQLNVPYSCLKYFEKKVEKITVKKRKIVPISVNP